MFEIESLYNSYKQDIFYYLISLTHNKTLSEDLLSETFLQTIKSIATFSGKSSIKTWLFGIARNVWLQNLHKNKFDLVYDDLLEIYVADEMDNNLITKLAITRAFEIIESKCEPTKTIVKMRIDGYSYFDIALKTSISESSARVIDFRTKRTIKSILEKEGLL